MIITDNVEKAKKLIKIERNPIIIKAQDDVFNRKIIEYGKFNILLDIESGKRKDKLKFLDSGLNEILANIAHKNRVSIGVDIESIKNMGKKDKAIRIARIKKNIVYCRKKGVKILAINYKDSKNTLSLLESLGASSHQAKESISF